ncbi:lysylphosphatidylglycerol synthase domain-containing protein [uncultured Jannaschia sp.]|uniref:lysylphosphatidylglycerol synthase domain-containing protein n=1 Tax=uncultured Jannaschia sp. TaxID=293347 RepID=UPI0026356DA0|nr:lysylphosphatidylglycerol synthase domain-containing protein [uncultured Jannaschia sp.]
MEQDRETFKGNGAGGAASHEPWLARAHRWLAPAATALLFAAGLAMLHRLLAPIGLAALRDQLTAVTPMTYLGAFAATALAYGVFIGFDRVALSHLRLPVRPAAAVLGAALGYAVGNTVGLSALSGGAARWRVYAREGLDGWQVAAVSTFTTVAYGIGAAIVGLAALAVDPTALAALSSLSPVQVRLAALAALAAGAVGLSLQSLRRRPIALGRLRLRPVALGVLGRLLALTLAEMGLAAVILHLLLPPGTISWLELIVVYAAATLAAVASHVPGGVGVFEGAVIAALPTSVPASSALAALLVFRLIYLVVPFLPAMAVLPFVRVRAVPLPAKSDCRIVIPPTGGGDGPTSSRMAWGAMTAARDLRRWTMRMTNTKLGLAALAALGLLGGAAAAQSGGGTGSDDQAEAQALMATNMTLSEAISAAEDSGGGHAMSAEFDHGDDGERAGFEVELAAADGSISKFFVGATDGAVTSYDDASDDGDGDGEDND